MTIHATTLADFATSLSRRIHRKLDDLEPRPKLSTVRDAVASALGHRNWHALSRHASTAPATEAYAGLAELLAPRLAGIEGVGPTTARLACDEALGLGHPAGPPRAAGGRKDGSHDGSHPVVTRPRLSRLDAMLDSVAITARRVSGVGGTALPGFVAFGALTIAIGMSDEDDDIGDAYDRLFPTMEAADADVIGVITEGKSPDPCNEEDPRMCLGLSAGPMRAAEKRAYSEFMVAIERQVETLCARTGRDVGKVGGMVPFAMAQGASSLCLSARRYALGIALAEYGREAAMGNWREKSEIGYPSQRNQARPQSRNEG